MENLRFWAAAIFRLASSLRLAPKWYATRFAMCSGVCSLPSNAACIFRILTQSTGRARAIVRNFNFVSSECRFPRIAVARFSTSVGFFFLPDWMRLNSSRVSLEALIPRRLSAIFIRVSTETRCPTEVLAKGYTLYPQVTASRASIQCCSRSAKTVFSQCSSTRNSNAYSPCLFQEFWSFGLQWRWAFSWFRWTANRVRMLTALPTYDFPVTVFVIA